MCALRLSQEIYWLRFIFCCCASYMNCTKTQVGTSLKYGFFIRCTLPSHLVKNLAAPSRTSKHKKLRIHFSTSASNTISPCLTSFCCICLFNSLCRISAFRLFSKIQGLSSSAKLLSFVITM